MGITTKVDWGALPVYLETVRLVRKRACRRRVIGKRLEILVFSIQSDPVARGLIGRSRLEV